MLRRSILLATFLTLVMAGTALALPKYHHIGTEFTATVHGCSVNLVATPHENSEDGAWVIIPAALVDRSVSVDRMVRNAVAAGAVHGTYDIRRSVLQYGPYTLATGSYVLMWDAEPIGSWETSHEEFPFAVNCRTQTPPPTNPPFATPSPPQPDSGGSHEPTPPPTDTVEDLPQPPQVPAIPTILAVLAILAAIVFLLTPREGRR
jgi:hypothetical protein